MMDDTTNPIWLCQLHIARPTTLIACLLAQDHVMSSSEPKLKASMTARFVTLRCGQWQANQASLAVLHKKLLESFRRSAALHCDGWHPSCRLQYHYESDRVTADERVYYREGAPRLVQVMPHTPQPLASLLAEEHEALLAAERDCLQVVIPRPPDYSPQRQHQLPHLHGMP